MDDISLDCLQIITFMMQTVQNKPKEPPIFRCLKNKFKIESIIMDLQQSAAIASALDISRLETCLRQIFCQSKHY